MQFLVAAGLLDEESYRDWLAGRGGDLQSRLCCALDEAVDALEQARSYLRMQGLTVQPRSASPRADGAQASVGASRELVELCASCLAPSGAQRDLFQDSALAAAESTVQRALAEQQLDAVREGMALVSKLGASRAVADAYRTLIDAAERDSGAADRRMSELEDIVTPLASRMLGSHAFAYLAARWRSLAKQLRGTPFAPSAPALHASYANARAAQWRSVIDDVECEARWQQYPVLRGATRRSVRPIFEPRSRLAYLGVALLDSSRRRP